MVSKGYATGKDSLEDQEFIRVSWGIMNRGLIFWVESGEIYADSGNLCQSKEEGRAGKGF